MDAYAAPCATATDQRGITRPRGSLCDIGATEQFGPPYIVDTLVDESDGDFSAGDFSLREAVEQTNATGGADEINVDPGIAGGTITLGSELAVTDDVTLNGSGITLDGGSATRIMQVSSAVTVIINDLTFQNASASLDGGAMENFGTLTITSSTFTGNQATRDGGAIVNGGSGTLTITGSTFSDNQAFQGGAIANFGTLEATSSTFSGNQADFGGAIAHSGTVTITSSTFSTNLAPTVGGTLYHGSGTVNVVSSLMVDGDCSGTFTDGGNNLSFSATGCPGIVADPQLGPLQNNGGPTDTMLPATDGPAVDAYAAPCATATDQRGIARPQGPLCDIGATEQVGTIALDASATCNGDNLEVTISAGDSPFDVLASSAPPGNSPLNDVPVGVYTGPGPGTWTNLRVIEQSGDNQIVVLGDFTCAAETDTPIPPTDTPVPPTDTPVPPTDTPVPPTDTPVPPTDTPTGPVALIVSAVCVDENLAVTISTGDGPFNITASAGVNTPVNGVNTGTTTINGPEKWDNLTVTETTGDTETINLGQFKCRSDEKPTPLTPAHQSHTTNAFPLFSWTAITNANNYRVFVFDDKVPASRTVDIRQNSGGPTSMTLSTPLPDGRLFWRVRGRQNRLWSLWSVRFTLFKDPAPPFTITTPVPTIDLNPRSGDGSVPNPVPTVGPVPTFPAPPNSR